jgi:hypothetical protein
MLHGEGHLHTGGLGRCHATVDGHESTTNSTHAHRYTVVGNVPEVEWVCHEHLAAPHCQAGNLA